MKRLRGAAWAALVLTSLGAGCADILSYDEFGEFNSSAFCEEVHGCTRADACKSPSAGPIGINFDSDGYSEPCMCVTDGATVTFTGDFNEFPLAGGVHPDKDERSPIQAPPGTPESAPFSLSSQCVFPYFSDNDGKVLKGAIFISEP